MPRAFKQDWYDKQKLLNITALKTKAAETKASYDKYNLKYYDLKKIGDPKHDDRDYCDHTPEKIPKGASFSTCLKCRRVIELVGGKWVSYADEKTLPVVKMADPDDVKMIMEQLKQSYETLCKEFDIAKATMRAGLGDRPIKMRLSATFLITTTVTTGVTNTVNINGNTSGQLSPTACTEWSTLAALFDEYKCTGGHCDFIYSNATSAQAVAKIPNNIPVIGYDPSDGTALTSSVAVTQLAQHKTITTPVTDGTVTTIPAMGVHHQFEWHVPRGTAIGGSASVQPGTEWIAVDGASAAGFLKFHHVGTVITAVDTGAGFIYFNLEFRCRS